jgi:hypothetical protein
MELRFRHLLAASVAASAFLASPALAQDSRDLYSDTWVAMDTLGRQLPVGGESGVPTPRADRFVGMFYFLTHGEHGRLGPFDITKILAKDPEAMQKPDSPLWGPVYSSHHWGEPLFGYYLSRDEWVYRKHAQMLSDAGVDTVIFDVTNQYTYPRSYGTLCKVWSQIRAEGGKTPQIAFLAPFGDPSRVAKTLYTDFYKRGDYSDLWFRWEGKPLIMADPALINAKSIGRTQREPAQLSLGDTLGQTFHAEKPLTSVGIPAPTWNATNSSVTVSLYDTPGGKRLKQQRFRRIKDNEILSLTVSPALPPGDYYVEMSQPSSKVGWWSLTGDVYNAGRAYQNGMPVSGDRTVVLQYANDTRTVNLTPEGASSSPEENERLAREIKGFFTFRKPQPDYFQGPTGPNQWSWLEAYPQHAFYKTPGVPEQMSVGIAQNAVDGKLSVLSNPRAYGRSFHNGVEPPPSGQDFTGKNFTEQWTRALEVDPAFVFVTGWNEWTAGRFPKDGDPFYGMGQVNFVDQFDQEYSRDIEPMKGGHGDDYYYQLISYVRRYKGARSTPSAGPSKTLSLGGDFTQWATITLEYRDDRFDTLHRKEPGWNEKVVYRNDTGRNDFETLKMAHDSQFVYAYARTRQPISSARGEWMNLYLNTDKDLRTGWMGFDFAINRSRKNGRASLEKWNGATWETVSDIDYQIRGNEIELAISRSLLGLPSGPLTLDFKWTDNTNAAQDALNLYTNGDTAPNGRFAYHYQEAITP